MKQPTFRELLLSEMARTGLTLSKVRALLGGKVSRQSAESWMRLGPHSRQPVEGLQKEVLGLMAKQPTEPLRALAERWTKQAGELISAPAPKNEQAKWKVSTEATQLLVCSRQIREVIAKQVRDGK